MALTLNYLRDALLAAAKRPGTPFNAARVKAFFDKDAVIATVEATLATKATHEIERAFDAIENKLPKISRSGLVMQAFLIKADAKRLSEINPPPSAYLACGERLYAFVDDVDYKTRAITSVIVYVFRANVHTDGCTFTHIAPSVLASGIIIPDADAPDNYYSQRRSPQDRAEDLVAFASDANRAIKGGRWDKAPASLADIARRILGTVDHPSYGFSWIGSDFSFVSDVGGFTTDASGLIPRKQPVRAPVDAMDVIRGTQGEALVHAPWAKGSILGSGSAFVASPHEHTARIIDPSNFNVLFDLKAAIAKGNTHEIGRFEMVQPSIGKMAKAIKGPATVAVVDGLLVARAVKKAALVMYPADLLRSAPFSFAIGTAWGALTETCTSVLKATVGVKEHDAAKMERASKWAFNAAALLWSRFSVGPYTISAVCAGAEVMYPASGTGPDLLAEALPLRGGVKARTVGTGQTCARVNDGTLSREPSEGYTERACSATVRGADLTSLLPTLQRVTIDIGSDTMVVYGNAKDAPNTRFARGIEAVDTVPGTRQENAITSADWGKIARLGPVVTLAAPAAELSLTATGPMGKIDLYGAAVHSPPVLATLPSKSVTLPTATVQRVIDLIGWSASSDPSRPGIARIIMFPFESRPLVAVSTNGHSICVWRREKVSAGSIMLDLPPLDAQAISLCSLSFPAFKALFTGCDQVKAFAVHRSEEALWRTASGAIYTTDIQSYPEYPRVIPEVDKYLTISNKAREAWITQLKQMIKRKGEVGYKAKGKGSGGSLMRLEIFSDEIKWSSTWYVKSGEDETATGAIPITADKAIRFAGAPFVMGIDPAKVLDVITRMTGAVLFAFQYDDGAQFAPTAWEGSTGDGSLAVVVMPVRL